MAKNDSGQFTNKKVNSAANNNATLVKAGGMSLRQIMVFNASAATKYIRFYDKATAPTVGTDVPVFVVAVPATSSKEIIFDDNTSIPFSLGLGYAITGGAAVLDNTSVAAGDVLLYLNAV